MAMGYSTESERNNAIITIHSLMYVCSILIFFVVLDLHQTAFAEKTVQKTEVVSVHRAFSVAKCKCINNRNLCWSIVTVLIKNTCTQ